MTDVGPVWNNTKTFASSDHQSIYIGVPVPRGYRRKRRRRRSSREASDVDRSRHYSQHRHHEDSRYRDVDVDMDVEEGLTDSNEQSLHQVNHTGEPGALSSPLKLLPMRPAQTLPPSSDRPKPFKGLKLYSIQCLQRQGGSVIS